MPESTRRAPRVAQMEDCDSDGSTAMPNTRVQATMKAPSVRPVQTRGPTSSSKHASHEIPANTSAHRQDAAATLSSSRQATQATVSKARPTIDTGSVQQGNHNTLPQPACASAPRPGNPERRFTLPDLTRQEQQVRQEYIQQYAAWAAQYPQAAAQYEQQAYAQAHAQAHAPVHAQAQVSAQTPPTYAQPTPVSHMPATRAPPTSITSRPTSFYGYPVISASTNTHHGPPPSPSAYKNLAAHYQQYQQYPQAPPQQHVTYLGTTPPAQTIPAFPVQFPATRSPTSSSYSSTPAVPRGQPIYSARHADPEYSSSTQGLPRPTTSAQPVLPRTMSARQPSTSRMPGNFDSYASESASEVSEPEYSEDEHARAREREDRTYREPARLRHDRRDQEREDQERQVQERKDQESYERLERQRKRDSKTMPQPPLRRPSMHSRQSAPVANTSYPSRPMKQRTTYSDTSVDHRSSSEQFDSDRTGRANVGSSRTESVYSSRSRQPSVSTGASSRGTKATSISEGSGFRKVKVEDEHGVRRTAYMTQEQLEDKLRYHERAKREEREELERAEAYQQQQQRGVQRPELTAESIRKAGRRTSGSHVSRDSRKSATSRSSKPEGIKIQAGNTVLHVTGQADIEMQAGEDGGPVVFKIGNSGGKDSVYHGSSKGSRVSRRKEPTDGYESGY